MWDQEGALPLAEQAAERARQLAPDIAATHSALGVVAYAKREFDKALVHREEAQRLQPSGAAALAVGMVLRRLGMWQQALDQFEVARRLTPGSYFIFFDALGYTNACLRRFDKAEEYFDQAISLAPHQTIAYINKAAVLVARSGDLEGAKRVVQEMSRRTNVEEEAERVVTEGLAFSSDLRLHSEMYSKALGAFSAGRMNRYRTSQPAVVAATHLYQALLLQASEGRPSARAHFDSARVSFERLIQLHSQSAFLWRYHMHLGMAYAGLGRNEDAIREGQEAIRIMPIAKDAFVGYELGNYLAEIYLMCGQYESAIEQIAKQLAVPGYMTPALLRADPLWDPVRNHPRFRRLLEGN